MMSQLRAWAQLFRVPNTLTASADVLAGFTIAAGTWLPLESFALSLLAISVASICFYWSGMVLNDVNDVDEDRSLRKRGPIVDGMIPIGTARMVGRALLGLGIGLSILASLSLPSVEGAHAPSWLVPVFGVLLGASVLAYDSPLKATAAGPLLMGVCRGLNLSLGIALGSCVRMPSESDWTVIGIAVMGHVCFVMGITLAARREGKLRQSSALISNGWRVGLFGVVAIGLCSWWSTERELRLDPKTIYPLLVVLLMIPWMRRAWVSVSKPGLQTLVPAIKQAILSIIFLDAAMALQFGGSIPGMAVCVLAIPTVLLGRVFRMT